ncbi:flagellar biosynthesis anti-sigma factor FlgM [Shewanella salipaludis]|uniref:Negative regulator of flagellin synthesis n=1 Tax=Shewanella salipaludis TaxID=2723052 RepID=A0A972FTL1_9GAMM|nr:flagellar biosynthesis anti-sigma factor FlgM [Shewanella salipaludis]NMH65531.1 flagellar biosynthesis anti-sigma factor FlgM [Shewanella salipaludis]
MAMDINKLNTATNAQMRSTQAKSTGADTAQVAKNSGAPKGDSVVITPQAQQLQGVQTKMASLPEVDSKKVAEIKQAIIEGRYKVDPEKLAVNIAGFESELSELNKE